MKDFLKKLKSHFPRLSRHRGQSLPIMVIALPAVIAAMGIAIDIGNLYYNDYKLQTADDASVLAGAHCLEGTTCTATTTATSYATTNGVKNTDTVSGPTVGSQGGNPTLTMTISRTVPYYFARWAGVNNGTVNVTAEAEVGLAGGLNDALPLGLQACGAGIAVCPNQYTIGQQLTFGAKKNDGSGSWVSGSGDWSALQGTATPSNTVSSCPPPAPSCTSSQPGFAAIKAIIDEANALGAGAIVCVPMVDWSLGGSGCNGNCSLNVYGFAAIQLGNPPGVNNGPNNSSVNATFVNSVCDGTFTSGGGGNNVGAFAEKLIL